MNIKKSSHKNLTEIDDILKDENINLNLSGFFKELSEEKGIDMNKIKSDAVPGEFIEPSKKVVEDPKISVSVEDQTKIPVEEPATVTSSEVLAGGGYMPKIGGKVAEDIRMTAKAFNLFIIAMKPITDANKCPQKGETIDSPFDNQVMPELSCFGGAASASTVSAIASGGRKTRKHKSIRYTRKNKKGIKKHIRKTKKHIRGKGAR